MYLPSKTYKNRLPTRCSLYNFAALHISFAIVSLSKFLLIKFSYQYFSNKKRRTTKVIRRIFLNRVFYAGRQPRYPAEYHQSSVI